jgi:hypothetical protein
MRVTSERVASERYFKCRHVYNFTLNVGYSRCEDRVGKTHAWVLFGPGCFDSSNSVKTENVETAMAMFFKLFDYEQPNSQTTSGGGGRRPAPIPAPLTVMWPAPRCGSTAAPGLGDSDTSRLSAALPPHPMMRQNQQQPQQDPDASVWQPTPQQAAAARAAVAVTAVAASSPPTRSS